MASHRPLSQWVARVQPGSAVLGAVNDGDRRADARHLPTFSQGWHRRGYNWNGLPVLALCRAADSLAVVELDDYGKPIVASGEAITVITRIEEHWPQADTGILMLAGESLSLRYWLLQRLDAEGEPPDELFGVLPWQLVDRAAVAIRSALEPGEQIGELVEMRHWLTPAVRGVTGPMEQLDHGLRTGAPDIAERGAATLLRNLRDLPLARIPADSRRRLAALVDGLGRAMPEHHDLAVVVERRLIETTSAVPDDLSSLVASVVPTTYAGSGDVPQASYAKLEFDDAAHGSLGPDAIGRLARTGAELGVSLTRVAPGAPRLTVDTGEPGAVRVPLEAVGRALRARIPWDRPELPQRLVFRVVSG
jgi:hypothetical protein